MQKATEVLRVRLVEPTTAAPHVDEHLVLGGLVQNPN